MAITRSVNTANDPKLGPVFSFKTYERSQAPFYNNNSQIDFVTWNGNLYVCVEDKVSFKAGNPADNGFLLLIQKGADGRPGAPGAPGKPGPMPEYSLKFDGKQLVIIDQNGVRKAVSPELTGPSWFPELQGHTIVWKRKEAGDTSIPQNIDLDEIRPIEECPILLRLNSDNTKREAEKSGPGYYIQWKREGADEWTNLMSISELMNIALAGVCFWWDDAKDGSTDINGNPVQTLHFGHKQVVEATYDASKLGNKRIADVTLGDVLFDAGEIPFANYDADIAALNAYLCDLQNDLEAAKASIPTKVSQLINDVPYIKTVNGHHPNTAGELKLKTVDNIDLVGESNIPFATINGRPIVNTEANFEIPSDYLTARNLKTIAGQSLIKGSDSDGNISLRTVNGEFLIGTAPINVGTVRSVSVNGGTQVTPDTNGNVNITVSDGTIPGSGDGVGIDDIEFRLNGNALQYRISTNGSWGSWTNISLPSGTSGDGEHVDLQISNNILQIRYNGGSWQDIGRVNGGTGGTGDTINGFVSVTKDENTLIFTRQDGTTQSVTIPTSGDGSSVSIQQILSSGTRIATITINGVATDIYAPNGGGSGGGGDEPSGEVVTYNTFMVYQRTASSTEAPSTDTITAATWNTSTHELDLTSNYWTNHPENAQGENKYLWMTCATFRSDTGARVDNWSTPVCLTGTFGDGDDSRKVEFIYRSVTAEELNAVLAVRPVGQYNDNRDDNYPASDNLATRQWSDNPVGISKEYPYELAASRKTNDSWVWQAYSMPFVWSRWGEDGVDGDGVEYTFRLATASEVDENEGVITLKSSVDRPSNSWAYDSPVAPWTDEPSGVSESNPYEFCSLRKTKIVNKEKVWDNWSEPALWSKYSKDGQNGTTVTITNQVRYYKASAESTGITAPATNLDPTLSANGGWSTSSNTIQLTSELPYLWMFERITYSNGNIWQSDPVIIRYLNDAVQVDYETLAGEVEAAISDDLTDLTNRVSSIETSGAKLKVDEAGAAASLLANYIDSNQKSFAEIIVDGKGAKVAQAAGFATADQMTGVHNRLDAIEGEIENAVTQQDLTGAIDDARQSITADAINQTVTAAHSIWYKTVNNETVYEDYEPGSNETVAEYNQRMINTGWTLSTVADKMSAIQQKSDKIWMAVGDGDNVAAAISILADADTTGGKIQLDANHIVLNGETTANALNAYFADVQNANIDELHATNANIEGHIEATTGNIGGSNGIYVDGQGKVRFGSDVVVTWDQPTTTSVDWDDITNKPDIPTDLSDLTDNNGIIDDAVDDLRTEIGNNYIRTGSISANDITTGTLDASKVTISNLVADQITANSLNGHDIVFGNTNIYIGSVSNCPYDDCIVFVI